MLDHWNREEVLRWVRRNTFSRSILPTAHCIGFFNTSLFTGNIDFQNLVSSSGFWALGLTSAHLDLFPLTLRAESTFPVRIDCPGQ